MIHGKLFDKALCARLEEWAARSPRFVQFVNQNENKIYKRLNVTITDEDKRDIGIELYIAFVFSQENCNLIYEPNILSISRGPDFKISFENYSFYLEIKRLRKYIPKPEDISINEETGDRTYLIENAKVFKKCGDVVIEKIGQTVPKAINLIYIRHYLPDAPNIWDLKSAIKNIKEWKDENPRTFEKKIENYKINSIEEFNKYWRQLSAIVISRPEKLVPQIWENPEALQPLPSSIKMKVKDAMKLSFRYDHCDK